MQRNRPGGARTPSGPGRGRPRSRAGLRSHPARTSRARSTQRKSADVKQSLSAQTDPALSALTSEGSKPALVTAGAKSGAQADKFSAQTMHKVHSFAQRALVVVLILGILVLFYAPQMRRFLDQRVEIGAKESQIAASKTRIQELSGAIERWQDDEYVKIQARDRLGWVMPGDTAYVVVDKSGKPIAGSSEITKNRALEDENQMTWWQRVWDSVYVTDQMMPTATVSALPAKAQTPSPNPSASPTPSR